MTRFNIRVYGIIINDDKILLSQEQYAQYNFLKFPGGGLEYGEGILDALHREFLEELNLTIPDWTHYYTTEFYQKSMIDDAQIISIYYISHFRIEDKIYTTDVGHAKFYPLKEELLQHINLPIDNVVMKKLLQKK